jgi:nitroreductase
MDTLEAIFTRRSIRKYTNQPVSEEQIEQLLRAAMAAPSAGNQQPWHFIIIRDKKIMEEITKFHPYSSMLNDAQAAIIVCGDKTLEKYEGYWIEDCSLASQNLLLAAQNIGLGTVWLGVYPRPDRTNGVRKLFDLPEHIVPLNIISIGYPAEKPAVVDRFKKERIHLNCW